MGKLSQDKATSIRKGEELDKTALTTYLKKHVPELQGDFEIKQFPGGHSNLTYLLKFEKEDFVLRRPPFGANIKSAHDMGREFKILSALNPTFSKAPRTVHFSQDHSVMDCDFYIMERVDGIVLRSGQVENVPNEADMRATSESLIDTLVELHTLDYKACGLGDFGRPEGYVERQITGWTKRYNNAKTDDIPEIDHLAKWLYQNVPKEGRPGLIHNDYKYDNVMLKAENPTEVRAILDWEMATLGDTLMDFGTALSYWISTDDPDVMHHVNQSPTTLPGNPTRTEVAEMYAQKSGQKINNVHYYYAYGLFKLAGIIQQIYARYKRGFTRDQRFKNMIQGVEACAKIGWRAVEKKRIDDLF